MANIIISLIIGFNFLVVGMGLWMAFKMHNLKIKEEPIPIQKENSIIYEEDNGVWYAYYNNKYLCMHADLDTCKLNAQSVVVNLSS